MALATTATEGVTSRTAWANLSWGDTLLDFWDDFSDDGRLDERDAARRRRPDGLARRERDSAAGRRTRP